MKSRIRCFSQYGLIAADQVRNLVASSLNEVKAGGSALFVHFKSSASWSPASLIFSFTASAPSLMLSAACMADA